MTDKKDNPGKAPEGGGKRPYATLDLKAVEVTPDGSKQAEQAARQPQASAPKAPEPAMPRNQAEAARKVAAASEAARAGAASPGGKPAGAASASVPMAGARAASDRANPTGGAPDKASPAATSASEPGATAPGRNGAAIAPRQRGTSLSGFLSHAAAGVVGGVLALLAMPHVEPLLREAGLMPASAIAPSPEVVGRLASLEQRLSAQASVDPAADPARILARTQANASRIEQMSTTLGAVAEQQGRLAGLTADLEARLAKEPPIADAAARLLKLEQQLATLAQAAQTEPQSAGRIPQLAGITGRLSDLEASVTSGLQAVRKDIVRDIDGRMAPVAEASEAARVGTQRIDREVATVKSEQNRLATGLDQVRTATDRLQLALKSSQDETAALGTRLDGLKRDVDGRLNATAKPADVSLAVAPVAQKLTSLEQSLAGVVKSEAERKATAERIVLALELGNLKRAMERGQPYARELDEVRKVAGGVIDLTPLDRYRNEGVQTLPELTREFRAVANAIIDAEAEKGDGSVVDRLLSGAKTFVRVRKTAHASGDTSAEAVVARMEAGLKAGRLDIVLAEAKALPQQPGAAKDWLLRVEARQTVEAALAAIDRALKSSLGAGPAPEGQGKKP
jgi:hypothetical protein